jgi:hypothetical protein
VNLPREPCARAAVFLRWLVALEGRSRR